MEELKQGKFIAVLLAKHDVTRHQKFVFGETTIYMVRNSPVSLLVPKGSPDKEIVKAGKIFLDKRSICEETLK